MLTQTKSKHLIKLNINLFGGDGGGSLSEDFSKNRQRNQRFTYYEDVDKLTLNLSLSLSLVYFK